jgi:septal ring factor EnvC (AmiA/AmiB activator)
MNADERAVARVTLARRSLEILSRRLEIEHGEQTDLLDRLADEKRSIERRLKEHRGYLADLTDQIRAAVDREDRSSERRRHRAVLRRLAEDRRGADRGADRGRAASYRPVGRASGLGRLAVRWALTQIGKPYRWGAAGPSAYDCSGLTMRAYQSAGVRLPHSSRAQYSSGRRLQRLGELRPGDLLFFGRGSRSIHHVGLYIGNGRMVHAPYSGTRVRVSSIARRNFIGAARP